MESGGYRRREIRAALPPREEKTMSRPGVAALLSFIVPGVGQIYNGDILRGLFWLVITPGLWVGSGGLLGWVCHLIAAATAYTRGEMKERQRLGLALHT
jgi:TM2 domain-containing membrane protein YozV